MPRASTVASALLSERLYYFDFALLALGTPELHGPLALLAGDRVRADIDPQVPHPRRPLLHGSPHDIKANG